MARGFCEHGIVYAMKIEGVGGPRRCSRLHSDAAIL